MLTEFKLVSDESVVYPACGGERGVVAGLGHAAAVEHHYAVGRADRGEPVGHHHHGAPAVERGEVLHDHALVACVQRVGCLVEEYELRVAVDSPRNQYALPLPLASSPVPSLPTLVS